MGTAPLGGRLCRHIARAIDEPVKRAVGHGGYDFEFVTFDHRHGSWSKRTGEVTWLDDPMHWSSCLWNFGTQPVPEHLCGARTDRFAPLGARLDAVCAEPADHAGNLHRCGSLTWEQREAASPA